MPFIIDPFYREMLLEGVDELGLTLKMAGEIEGFEKSYAAEVPWRARPFSRRRGSRRRSRATTPGAHDVRERALQRARCGRGWPMTHGVQRDRIMSRPPGTVALFLVQRSNWSMTLSRTHPRRGASADQDGGVVDVVGMRASHIDFGFCFKEIR